MTPEENDDLDAWLNQFAPEMDSSQVADNLTGGDDFLRTVRQGQTHDPNLPVSAPPAAHEPMRPETVLPEDSGWASADSPVAFSAPAAPPPTAAAAAPAWQGVSTAGDPVPEAAFRSTSGMDWDNADDISEETWQTATGGHEVLEQVTADRRTFTEDDEESAAGNLLLEWIPILLGAIIVAALVRTFVFQAFFIPSESMVHTLEVGDRVLVNKLSYDFNDVGWGDLVVFKRPPNAPDGEVKDLIKRVMALPGDRIQFHNGDVFVNNVRVQETYLREQGVTFARLSREIPNCVDPSPDACTIPEGRVFMMGDNRRESTDSRIFGPVDTDLIVGRAFVRVWPLTDVGTF